MITRIDRLLCASVTLSHTQVTDACLTTIARNDIGGRDDTDGRNDIGGKIVNSVRIANSGAKLDILNLIAHDQARQKSNRIPHCRILLFLLAFECCISHDFLFQ